MGFLNDARVEAVLDRLHAQSSAQDESLGQYFAKRAEEGTLDWKGLDADAHRFMSDKLVALDRDKAALCYQLCRALRARRVVEVGTSFGVSTLYLAAAVRDNAREDGGYGRRDRERVRAGQSQRRARALCRGGAHAVDRPPRG